MRCVANPRPLLLGLDLAVEVEADALELADHLLELETLRAFSSAMERFSRPARSHVPSSFDTPHLFELRLPDRTKFRARLFL